MNEYLPLARKTEILIQETEAETLIYDLTANKALCLNQTSVSVWRNCDGTKTVSEISGVLEKKFGEKVDDDLVWLAIDQLGKENLLENEGLPQKFYGESRRDVIKKIGLASMIALPIVGSIVAPKAIQAQSCGAAMNLPDGCPCTLSGECAGGCCEPSPAGRAFCVTGGVNCL